MNRAVERDSRREEWIARTIASIVRESGMSPPEISNGWCFWFANRLAKALGPASQTVSTSTEPAAFPGHWAVQYDGKFFDAETPQGVKHLRDLNYCRRLKRFMNDETIEDSIEGLLFGKKSCVRLSEHFFSSC